MLEARKARRYTCNEGVDCELAGQVVFGLLQDVSISGARLRGLALPAVGTLLRVAPAMERLNRQWVFCQVCWIRRGEVEEAGLRFLEPPGRLQASWVGTLLEAGEPFERRESVRILTEVPIQIRSIGHRPVLTTSVDLSRDGAMVRALRNLRRSEKVEMSLRLPVGLLDVRAVVVEPASPTRAHHSVRFLGPPSGVQEALGQFIQEQRPQGRAGGTQGLALLKVMNR